MGSESELSVIRSMGDNELSFTEDLGNFGESESKLKSNGGYHVDDVNQKLLVEMKSEGAMNSRDPTLDGSVVGSREVIGSSTLDVSRRQGLRKWRRIPREIVKKMGSYSSSGGYGDPTVSPVLKGNVNVIGDVNGGRSVLPDDQQRNGRDGPGKKARGVKIEKGNSNSAMGSDSRSVNSVFVQGGETVTSKGRQNNMFGKYDDECSDDACHADKHLNEEARIEFMRSEVESHVVSLADGIRIQEGSVDQDLLVESVKGLHIVQAGFEREVQKWRDVGKDDPLEFNDPLHELLELKDAKILELETILKTKLEDRLRKIIQTEVEYVVITTTTKTLTEPLQEIKHDDLQQKNISSHAKEQQQDDKLETKEDIKKLHNKVCEFTSCFIIMLILLLVTLYLQFSPQNVEVVLVPT